jgi:predicted NAD/FAD-binding protein
MSIQKPSLQAVKSQNKPKIAIIGSGVAGITSAYLLQELYDVTLIEKRGRIGGHTHTYTLPNGPDQGLGIDTGFIVLNNRTYPNLHKLLRNLKVPIRDSDMSFGFYCEKSGFQYSGRDGWKGLLARKSNILKPRMWNILSGVFRFNRIALADLKKYPLNVQDPLSSISLGAYLQQHRLEGPFVSDYLIPITASIWSTSPEDMMAFPVRVFLDFMKNHGLLQVQDRPQWQTVQGGSYSYVDAFLKQFPGAVWPNFPIQAVERDSNGVHIHSTDGSHHVFDYVIFATHADQVLPLLKDPSSEEAKYFGPWDYQKNHVILHTDTSFLPPSLKAQASWNFIKENRTNTHQSVSVSYDMNRLQGLTPKDRNTRYLVSLNLQREISRDKVIAEFDYDHPTFTTETLSTVRPILELNGSNRTYYVGSYFRFGFHEDAVSSSVNLCKKHFGIDF